MKGQFMLISSIVIGLILMSTASTVSEIQSRDTKVDEFAHKINLIKSEVKETDLSNDRARKNLERTITQFPNHETKFEYWESQNCLNVTLENEDNRYKLSCVGGKSKISVWSLILNIQTLADFETKGSYNKLWSQDIGKLQIGYRDGETGDRLKGFWRFDKTDTSYDIEEIKTDNSFWNEGYSPDLNVRKIRSDLEYESTSTTDVTIEASNEGLGNWNTQVELYNYSLSSLSWTQSQITTEPDSIEFVVPADIDGDAEIDVIWGAEGGNIRWADNNDGSWDVKDIGDQDVESASVGDIDGDGDLDVVGVGNNDNVYLFENDGSSTPSFSRSQIDNYFNKQRSVALGDIDSDGDLDIAVTGFHNDVLWYENDGTGSFGSSKKIYDLPSTGWAVALGDIDGDNNLDIVTADNSDNIWWHENNGNPDPSFSTNTVDSSTSDRMFSLNLADIDEDGNIDILAGGDSEDLEAYTNDNGDGTSWTNQILATTTANTIRTIQSADIDYDGDQDFILGFDGGQNKDPYFVENNGSLSGWNTTEIGNSGDSGHYGIAIADFDEDGVLEIFSGEDEGTNNLRLWDTKGISADLIGSDTVSFNDVTGAEKNASISWTPKSHYYNFMARVSPSRSFTEILQTNDETAGSSNNVITQSISESGIVQDYSGENNDGDTADFEGDERGYSGVFNTSSFEFDGSDKVEADNPGSSLGTFTVSAWVNADNLESGPDDAVDDNTVVHATDVGDVVNEPFVLEHDESGDWKIQIEKGGSYVEASSFEKTVTEEWVHLTGTYDGDVIKLYINGQEEDSNSAPSGPAVTGTGNIEIGRTVNEQEFEGKIDEVRVYDEALSESEVEDLYFDGNTGDFRGSYTSNNNDVNSGLNITRLQVNSSIYSGTSSKIKLEHSSGNEHLVNLSTGNNNKNYSIPFSDRGGNIDINVRMNSTNETVSPVIREIKLWGMN